MGIFDYIDERNSSKQFVENVDNAWDYFIHQKSSIEGIAGTQGFREIRTYWEREIEACSERLRTMKSAEVESVQRERNLAKRFLDFLDNLLNAEIKKEDFNL